MDSQALLHDDPGRLAPRVALGGHDLVADALGDAHEGFGVLAVGAGHDDRPAAVGGLADLDVKRHLAEEFHAQLFASSRAPPWLKMWVS